MFSLELSFILIIVIIITFSIVIYYYLSRNFNYWSSRGIRGPKPWIVLGTFGDMFFKSLPEMQVERAKKYGKIYGTFMGHEPTLMIGDPQLIKEINIKDFHLFVNRTEFVSGDVMADRNLFNLLGDEWKKMRSIISPTFSSGKMLRMHPIIVDCANRLQLNLNKNIKNRNEVEISRYLSNFTLDVIACCAFGTKVDTYSQKEIEFVVNAQKALRKTWRIWVLLVLAFISPRIVQWLKFSFVEPSVIKYFKAIIRSIISRRESEKDKYNDYIQLMINARNRVQDNEEQDIDDRSEQLFRPSDDRQKTRVVGEISEDDILSTSFIFIAAGYENTAISLSLMLYSLAKDQRSQQKLYQEIQTYGPDFKYEDIANMPYLEASVAEALRLHNTISASSRVSSQDYKLGDTGITIPKGMIVNFDIQAIHHNPEYYEEPQTFNPERFLPENRHMLTPYTYMPFGLGPRNCVGMRFALMVMKTAVVALINKYRFFETENTPKELKPKKFELILAVGDIHIGIELRNKQDNSF